MANPRWILTVKQGPNSGQSYPITQDILTIGRSPDNQIVIDDPRISRHHVRLSRQNASVLIQDLGSANGTWVNQQKIASAVRLRAGDVVGLGQEILLELTPQPYDNDATILEQSRSAAVVPAVAPASFQPAPKRKNWLAISAIGLMGSIILILVVIVVGLLLFRGRSAFVAAQPTATATFTATTAPTATPYPTYTPVPTEPPTATPYPTYTPVPTEPPTATPYPTYTPYPTEPPTATPYPTYTPVPQKVVVIQATTPPQSTLPPPPPTATSAPPFIVSLGSNVAYEPWGKPGNPDGCGAPYDDRIEVRRFTVQVLLTNNSNEYIGEDWWPRFISASGAAIPSCWFYYNNVVAEPGETVDVTYATYLPKGDYVKAMVFQILGRTHTICLNPGGQQIGCP